MCPGPFQVRRKYGIVKRAGNQVNPFGDPSLPAGYVTLGKLQFLHLLNGDILLLS